MKKLALWSLVATVFLTSCGGDDEGNPDKSAGSVYVVNEGNFNQTNGSITSYDPQTEEVSTFVFQTANGRPLGDVAQSFFIDADEVGYVVVNNSKKIEVVNADFVSTATIDDNLANPRYLLRANDQLFVSNWGTFDENYALDQSYVLILDAETFEKEGAVNTEDGTENLAFADGYVYASNNFGNTVSVIKTSTGELEKTFEVGYSPGEMVVDEAGAVWLICGGSYKGNDGAIYKLGTSAATKEVDLEVNPSTRLSIDKAHGVLYFIAGTSVGSYKIAQKVLEKELITIDDAVGFYGLGYNEAEDVIYIADAKGFQGKGTVYRYSADGEVLSTFEAGVAPNGFVFK
jgi:DNA-binding beta-propeller fold protein YncE